jgi:hypothetical protein
MIGVYTGYLQFFVRDLTNGNTILIWRYGGKNLGNQWNYGSIGFFYPNPYTIVIQGMRGNSPGSISLDDIIFKESQFCSTNPSDAFTGNLPLPTTTTTKPTSTPIPSVYDCNFEKDFCNWQNDISRPLFWIRHQGSNVANFLIIRACSIFIRFFYVFKGNTIDQYTGPAVDHT